MKTSLGARILRVRLFMLARNLQLITVYKEDFIELQNMQNSREIQRRDNNGPTGRENPWAKDW